MEGDLEVGHLFAFGQRAAVPMLEGRITSYYLVVEFRKVPGGLPGQCFLAGQMVTQALLSQSEGQSTEKVPSWWCWTRIVQISEL